jgi:mono/diheme cytochrome c family protein
MIHPSYELAPYPKAEIANGGQSRMPSYADTMTIRQMTDIVAFLQAHYRVPRERNADVIH